MREKLEYIDSNVALIIVLEHTVPAARNAMYGHASDFRQHRAQPIAQAEHVEHRIGEIAEHRRNRELAPHEAVAAPDVYEAQAELG